MKPLSGCLRYDFELDDELSKKRKRSFNPDHLATQLLDATSSTIHEANTTTSSEEQYWAGWVLECNSQLYLLSIPRHLLRSAARVCQTSQSVIVQDYTLLPLVPKSTTKLHPIAFIEVHRWGLMDGSYLTVDPGSILKRNADSYTLRQLARAEVLDRQQKVSQYNFHGLLSAISPVVTIDVNDLFCLLELTECYDPINNGSNDSYQKTFICIVVLRGSALQMAASIQPGDRLHFHQATRKKWRIPHVLRQSLPGNNIPEQVFVVDKPMQVDWDDLDELECRDCIIGECFSHTNILLGRIINCHRDDDPSRVGSSSHRIHSVELLRASAASDEIKITLFLKHFPMSTSLQLSLRAGTVVRCLNLHSLGSGGYFANQRSHVSVVSFAGLFDQDIVPLSLLDAPPLKLGRIHQPDVEAWYIKIIARELPNLQPYWNELAAVLVDGPVSTKVSKSLKAYSEFLCDSKIFIQLPDVWSLHKIHEIAYCEMKQRLQSHSIDQIHVGWTSCVRLSEVDLNKTHEATRVWTAGSIIVQEGEVDGQSSSSLSYGNCNVPIVWSNMDYTNEDGKTIVNNVGWLRVRYVVSSCICITVVAGLPTHRSRTIAPLPSYRTSTRNGVPDRGPCALMIIKDRIFLISTFLVCDRIHGPLHHVNNSSQPAKDKLDHASVLSIGDVLRSKNLDDNRGMSIVGILARSFFQSVRVKSNKYTGYMLSISHAPSPQDTPDKVSVLQSIEVKPSVSIDVSRLQVLYNAVTSLIGQDIMKDQLSLGLVWWMLSHNGNTCALLGGGWDEATHESAPCRNMGILVSIPASTAQIDEKKGYLRFRCKLENMIPSVFFFESQNVNSLQARRVDFIGGDKHKSGMLDRRPRRRRFGGLACGDMLMDPLCVGIPECSISVLFDDLCEDLKVGISRGLRPSLVRKVRSAVFLGVSYCRVFAVCTKCHTNLQDISKTVTPTKNPTRDGVVSSVSIIDLDRVTHWHKPLPSDYSSEGILCQKAWLIKEEPKSNHTTKMEPGRTNTSLQCPNKCRVSRYGAIKWECSGILDDGTGQARLFSEQETSLCLLRIPSDRVRIIEEGAWCNEDGIVYSKSMPTKSSLRDAVLIARSLALDHCCRVHHNPQQYLQEKDVLSFLKPFTRAEYVLHQYCRSLQPSLNTTYYIRIKPLSDVVTHLKHTEVELFSGEEVTSSYTLPPLKLQLVDCCSLDN